MSWVSTTELWDKRRASIDEKAVRAYTRCFRVIMDNALDGSRAARESPGIPRIGEFYVDGSGGIDIGARCRTVTAEQEQDYPLTWSVTAEYGSGMSDGAARGGSGGGSGGPGSGSGQDPAQVKENPLERPAEISWNVVDFKRPVTRADLLDDNDNVTSSNIPIRNSAGAAYDPPAEIDDSRLELTVVRNELTYDFNLAADYQNATNADEFLGLPTGWVRCQGITGQSKFENNYYFWVVTYKFQIRKEGWILEILDAGTYELDGDGNPSVFLDSATGHTVGEPLPLDGEGARLTVGADPVFFRYRVYNVIPFAPLGLA